MLELKNAITNSDIDKIKALYSVSFPKEEQKPFDLILQKQEEKMVEILSIRNDSVFCGLVILAKYKNLILLDYFAIVEEFRGQKIGSNVIHLLQDHFSLQKLIIEIENPNCICLNKAERVRRKHFYLQNGLTHASFGVDLLGVDMEILTNNKPLTFEEYHCLYTKIYGQEFSQNIRLKVQ